MSHGQTRFPVANLIAMRDACIDNGVGLVNEATWLLDGDKPEFTRGFHIRSAFLAYTSLEEFSKAVQINNWIQVADHRNRPTLPTSISVSRVQAKSLTRHEFKFPRALRYWRTWRISAIPWMIEVNERLAAVYHRYQPFIEEVIPITAEDRKKLKRAHYLLTNNRTQEAVAIFHSVTHSLPDIPVSLREDLLYVNVDHSAIPRSRVRLRYAIGLVGIAAVMAEMMPTFIPPLSRDPLPESAVVTEVDGEVHITLTFPGRIGPDS